MADSFGALLVVATLACLLYAARRSSRSNQGVLLFLMFLAGVLAGLCFACKYVLMPAAAIGFVFLLVQWRLDKWSWARLVMFTFCYCIGLALPVLPILAHNIVHTGSIVPPACHSDVSFQKNISDLACGLTGTRILFNHSKLSFPVSLVLISSVFLLALSHLRSKASRKLWTDVLFGNGRYLLTFWAVFFPLCVVLLRTRIHFDPVASRFLISSMLVLVMLAVGVLTRSIRQLNNYRIAERIWCVSLILAIGLQLNALRKPVVSFQSRITANPGLHWVQVHTAPDDLVMAPFGLDITFYLHRPAAISYSAFPYTERLTWSQVQDFRAHMPTGYRRLLIVVTQADEKLSRSSRVYRWGTFVADLQDRLLKPYPQLKELVQEPWGQVYEIRNL